MQNENTNFYLHLDVFLNLIFLFHPNIALGNLGSVLSSQGRFTEAKAALQQALKHRPNMADVHYNL